MRVTKSSGDRVFPTPPGKAAAAGKGLAGEQVAEIAKAAADAVPEGIAADELGERLAGKPSSPNSGRQRVQNQAR